MARQCYVEPVSRHRALLALCFIFIFVMVGEAIGWYYTVRYFEDHRTFISVKFSPVRLEFEWKCRLCNANNFIVEEIK